MDIRKLVILPLLLLITSWSFGQLTGTVSDADGHPLEARVFIEESNFSTKADEKGRYTMSLPAGDYTVVFLYPEMETKQVQINYDGDSFVLNISLNVLSKQLDDVVVLGSRSEDLGISWLKSVEGVTIYESKKTELIDLSDVSANFDNSTSRQTFSRVPGLNIFENDGVGVQLAIGARGLDPNRTSNFNVRQNGYDIAADALGYPESYYTPPIAALQRIEIIRGAAGLQYGPQFGGLLNFKFKEGDSEKKLEFLSNNTVGSFGLFSTFNSLGGTVGKVNYYGFYQYKGSEGWRPNSDLNQHMAFGSVRYNFTSFTNLKAEFTHMNYLAQQPGGLLDAQFETDPTQSTRPRNWFQVGWNTGALIFNHRINTKIKINNRVFFLKANRYSLGDLGRVLDLEASRDLIKDDFTNWGNEIRATYNYKVGVNHSILLVGGRYYQGFTESSQGDGSADFDADFDYLGGFPNASDFEFPSRNISVFAENIFNIGEKLSVTPGLRYEHILTKADGFFTNTQTDFAGNVLFTETIQEERKNPRDFLLFGLGLSYNIHNKTEWYTNFSRNFRGINFTDIRVDIDNLVVDPDISDENGYNFDIGIRGGEKGKFLVDASFFFLSYQDRIGNTRLIDETTAALTTFRTNIGDAIILGLESYVEKGIADLPLVVFSNLALIHSEYTTINVDGVLSGELVPGNNVELVPAVNFKTGLKYMTDKWRASLLFSYVSGQFSEASNTMSSFNGGSEGYIPAYKILDTSVSYQFPIFTLAGGINNLLDEHYFARRAVGYPGPGIIPAQPRSYYLSLEFRL